MAVSNSLSKKRTEMYQNTQTAVYKVAGQKIELTPEIVRNYMVSGNKEAVSFEEIVMFMNLCKNSGLNPWAKEAYCIKYGNEPATMVIGKEAYMKRAESNDSYDGFSAGIIVLDKQTHEIIRRTGSFRLPTEDIVGGWAKVFRKDRSHPYESEVGFDEYAGRKKDGSLNSQWGKKPATMIRKVALVQALREAFPSAFGGMYSAEEKGFEEDVAGEVHVPPVETTSIEDKSSDRVLMSQVDYREPVHEEQPVNETQMEMYGNPEDAPEGQQTFFQ